MHCPHCGGRVEVDAELLSRPTMVCARCDCAWQDGALVVAGLSCPVVSVPMDALEADLLQRVAEAQDSFEASRDWSNSDEFRLMELRNRNLVAGYRLRAWALTERGRDVLAAKKFLGERA